MLHAQPPQADPHRARTRRCLTHVAAAWGGLALGVLSGASVASAAAAPAALPDSPALRAVVSSTLGRDDVGYALTAQGGGYAATLAGGGASALVRNGGVQVAAGGHRWQLSAAVVGRDGERQAAPDAARLRARRTARNRVDFASDIAGGGGAVDTWFVNGPAGLEEGWTIGRAPAGAGALRLELALAGDLRAAVSVDGRDLTLLPPPAATTLAGGGPVLRYGGLTAYDARGRQLAARFALRRDRLLVEVQDAGAVYPVTVDPFMQVAKLVAADGAAGDNLGAAVAISDDGQTVVAGAPEAEVGGHAAAGAVYVFSRPVSGWANGVQTAKLTASDGAASDQLGDFPQGVAISADGSTILAVAPFATVGGHGGQGAVYVFLRGGTAWTNQTQQAKLTAGDGAAGDELRAVAIDANATTVVASTDHAMIGSHAAQGALYVFARPTNGWISGTQTAKLTASDGAAQDGLGLMNAISGDGATIAAGAAATVDNKATQGAVYVYTWSPSHTWVNATQTAKLTASDGAAGDQLGFGVAVSSNGATIAAGASGAAIDSKASQGAVYVFARPTSGWANGTQIAKLTASDGARNDSFGTSVAISDDGSTILGGTRAATVDGNANQGAAYAFARPGAAWADATEVSKLVAGDGQASEEMGIVALSGDGKTAAVGATFATLGLHSAQGAIYVFSSRCAASATTICLDDQPGDGRWQVTTSFHTSEGGGHSGFGQAIALANIGVSHGGLFWFFDPSNPEMLLKVLNACGVNQHYWVFSSATTNVGFTVTVTDSVTGSTKVYTNQDGTAALPVQDTAAFSCTTAGLAAPAPPPSAVADSSPSDVIVSGGTPAALGAAAASHTTAALVASEAGDAATTAASANNAPAPPTTAADSVVPPPAAQAGCATTSTQLCIGDRFAVKAHYHTAQGGGSNGDGQAIALAELGVSQGGLFWFFNPTNPEMLVKVLNACGVNNRYWIFYAAGTNVGFTVTVTDTQTNEVKTYTNPDLTAALPVQDTNALPCN